MEETLLKKRDAKARPHLQQYAPVWIVEEKILADDQAVLFDVVFLHAHYGWVNRRYRYDGFNDVLYYRGQTTISESAAVDVQAENPYIDAAVADIPNAYGG